MQIGKILFWINVNLCFQYDGWPSGMEMPPTSMYGDHHARWEKNEEKYKKNPKTLLLQDCPGHLDGSPPRGSSPAHESFIQAGHLTQTVTKLQFDAKKLEKADRSATARRCPRCMIWTLATFPSHPPVKAKCLDQWSSSKRNKSKKLASINLLALIQIQLWLPF